MTAFCGTICAFIDLSTTFALSGAEPAGIFDMNVPVSEIIVRFMEKLGIKAVFGMPGAHILPVYDGLYDSSIEAVLAKHEQGAAFMADGYARISGQIGACIATAGPGATNLVTGVANAYADKRPVLVITGETPTYIFGKGGLQESSGEGGSIEQASIFKAITRYFKLIERTDYLANVLNQAVKHLYAETSGPVMLSIPYNVQKELVDEHILQQVSFPAAQGVPASSAPHPDISRFEEFADALESSRCPVIIAGFGVILADARESLKTLCRQFNIPVTSSLKGKGAFDEGDSLSLGSLGVTSAGHAYHYIVEQADLLIFLGAGFNERTSYLWNDKLLADKNIIQVDIDAQQLNKVFTADLTFQGDIGYFLDTLGAAVRERGISAKPLHDFSGFVQKMQKQTREQQSSVYQPGFSLVESFYSHLQQTFPAGLTVFDDNVIFAQNFFSVTDRNRFYPNTGVSALGHAIPAAVGAAFFSDGPMFAILGDGGFQMCCMEIMTAVNYSKSLNIVLFNNATMGLIRKNQFQQYRQRYINCDFINPDYAKLAASFGINYYYIDSEQSLGSLFENTCMTSGINLIEIPIDKDAFPNYQSKR